MRISTEHPYVTRVRRAKEVFDRNRHDPAPLFDLHAEQVVLHAPGTSPLGGGIRGRANVFADCSRWPNCPAVRSRQCRRHCPATATSCRCCIT